MSKYAEELKQLGDISYFINEAYSDHEPLTESQRDSRQCFMNYCKNIKQSLLELKQIKETKPSEALESLDYLSTFKFETDILFGSTKAFPRIRQALLKAQELEKENELLKEIIKILFDRGSPLHLYMDNELGLTIETDDDCFPEYHIEHLSKLLIK